jgi:ribosome-binding protein aMBF1 (putative translation factor)
MTLIQGRLKQCKYLASLSCVQLAAAMKNEKEEALLKAFGRHMASVRRTKKWSQEKLALESSLARSYVGDVERGIRNISLINICKVADTLDIDVLELMAFRKPKTSTNS